MPETGPCAHNNRTYTDMPGPGGTVVVHVTCTTCGAFLGSYPKP